MKRSFAVGEYFVSVYLYLKYFVFVFNPYLTTGFYNHYQLGESTFSFRAVRSEFYFLSHFSMKFLCANRIAPDGTTRSAVSRLGLYCLPMSHKRNVRVI